MKSETEKEVDLAEGLYPVGVFAVLNGMKPGEISPIMKLEIGYAVFKLNYRKEPEQLLSAAEGKLRKEIKSRKFEAEKARLVDELRSSADIKMEKRVMPDGEVQYLSATVNGVEIRMNPQLFSPTGDPHAMHQGMNIKTLNDALNKRVNQVLLSQEARRQGIHNDPVFQRELKLKKEELLANAAVEKIRGVYEPAPQDIKEYYEKNKEKFTAKTKVRVSRILLSNEDDAKAVLKELKGGKDFSLVASQWSTDVATKSTGGNVGFVTIDMVKEPIKGALKSLKVGEVSGVLKSEYGYEVLKVTERKAGRLLAMSTLTTTIRKRVKLSKESERVEAFYQSLHDKADIKINKELLKSLRK
jgi:parvulin-like peptidyl-prolyl isomerase